MTDFTVGLAYDPEMGLHQTDFHVESPERIYTLHKMLMKSGLDPLLLRTETREATEEELLLAHTPEYLHKLTVQLLQKAPRFADPDLYANQHTLKCAKLAVGSCLNLVTDERVNRGFAMVRPPGHHAMPGKCMGFCYFNNLGICAIHLARTGKRVLIVDWDVHHGNGTERLIRRNENRDLPLMFFSIHRYDHGQFYPGTGQPQNGEKIINIGFNGPQDDEFYLNTFQNVLLSRAKKFKPDIILVSCGFDAAQGDPLGQCQVTPSGYYQMTEILKEICPRIYLILEGGYNLQSISESFVACLRSLLDL